MTTIQAGGSSPPFTSMMHASHSVWHGCHDAHEGSSCTPAPWLRERGRGREKGGEDETLSQGSEGGLVVRPAVRPASPPKMSCRSLFHATSPRSFPRSPFDGLSASGCCSLWGSLGVGASHRVRGELMFRLRFEPPRRVINAKPDPPHHKTTRFRNLALSSTVSTPCTHVGHVITAQHLS